MHEFYYRRLQTMSDDPIDGGHIRNLQAGILAIILETDYLQSKVNVC